MKPRPLAAVMSFAAVALAGLAASADTALLVPSEGHKPNDSSGRVELSLVEAVDVKAK